MYIGVDGAALKWFSSYLDNRTCNIQLDGTYSRTLPPMTGVPQGLVLGPLLFCICIMPLGDIINACARGISRHGYTDDTQLYIHYIIDCQTLKICIQPFAR